MLPQTKSPYLKPYPFEFRGSGGEFFKIWIVNVLLTVITLGIYSAWAKVRTTRYFYGNTLLNESSFEYLANPIAILKGRLIAVALFIAYSYLSGISPIAGGVLILLFFAATPYIAVRAMRFNHRMSAYKNIRFNFEGSVGSAAMVYLVWPLLGVLSLGLLYPISHQRFVKFYVSNTSYGQEPFTSTAKVGQFYSIYMALFAVAIAVFAAVVVGSQMLGGDSLGGMSGDMTPEQVQAAMLPMILALYAASLFLWFILLVLIKSKFTNLIMNTMRVGGGFYFESRLTVGRVAWILFSNLILIICTVGLAYPWAKVRLANYRAEHTELTTLESLDEFLGQVVDETSAVGEEIGEIFDIETAAV